MAAPGRRVCDTAMTSRRLLIPAALAASAGLAPVAAAQAPPPTLAFERPCYSAMQLLAFSGSGYTPSGPVRLLFSLSGEPRAGFTGAADPTGAINGRLDVTEDALLLRNEERGTVDVTATDQTRAGAGAQPPESQFAATRFTFTRWAGFSPGTYVPGRKVRVEAFGWAFAAGKPLYFHFQKRRRTVAAVRAGVLSAECGDLVARIRVPKKLKPGAYRLVLATTKRTPSDADAYTWRTGRVARVAASPRRAIARAAADTTRMRRAG
jgi:hypothetical protein